MITHQLTVEILQSSRFQTTLLLSSMLTVVFLTSSTYKWTQKHILLTCMLICVCVQAWGMSLLLEPAVLLNLSFFPLLLHSKSLWAFFASSFGLGLFYLLLHPFPTSYWAFVKDNPGFSLCFSQLPLLTLWLMVPLLLSTLLLFCPLLSVLLSSPVSFLFLLFSPLFSSPYSFPFPTSSLFTSDPASGFLATTLPSLAEHCWLTRPNTMVLNRPSYTHKHSSTCVFLWTIPDRMISKYLRSLQGLQGSSTQLKIHYTLLWESPTGNIMIQGQFTLFLTVLWFFYFFSSDVSSLNNKKRF